MDDKAIINLEIKVMNRLIKWCLDRDEPYSSERIKQLITDWAKVSGNIIPEKIVADRLNKL